MIISERDLQIAASVKDLADGREIEDFYLAVVRGEEGFSATGALLASTFIGLDGFLSKDDAETLNRRALKELGVTVEST